MGGKAGFRSEAEGGRSELVDTTYSVEYHDVDLKQRDVFTYFRFWQLEPLTEAPHMVASYTKG